MIKFCNIRKLPLLCTGKILSWWKIAGGKKEKKNLPNVYRWKMKPLLYFILFNFSFFSLSSQLVLYNQQHRSAALKHKHKEEEKPLHFKYNLFLLFFSSSLSFSRNGISFFLKKIRKKMKIKLIFMLSRSTFSSEGFIFIIFCSL